MKNPVIAAMSNSGKQGKTTLSRHLLMANIPNAIEYCIDGLNTPNEGAISLDADEFLERWLEIIVGRTTPVILDIGAAAIKRIHDNSQQTGGGELSYIDLFMMPLKPGATMEKETIETIEALRDEAGVPLHKIVVVPNGVPASKKSFQEIFPELAQFTAANKIFVTKMVQENRAISLLDKAEFRAKPLDMLASTSLTSFIEQRKSVPQCDIKEFDQMVTAAQHAKTIQKTLNTIAQDLLSHIADLEAA